MAHLAAEQLDSVVDREEVAHHIVESAIAIHTALGPGLKVPRLKDGIQRMIWRER